VREREGPRIDPNRLVLRASALPLIVLAIVVPIAAGFLVQGPALGLALGALIATGLLVYAARQRPEEPIEVARSPDRRRRILLVASGPVDEPEAAQAAEVLVLAPARSRFLDRWASDLEPGRREAQRQLVLSVAALAAARVDASGRVGDDDLVQAVEDTLTSFPASEVILATGPRNTDPGGIRALEELRRRLDRPLRHLVLAPGGARSATSRRSDARRV
jgi:hypothetical protein